MSKRKRNVVGAERPRVLVLGGVGGASRPVAWAGAQPLNGDAYGGDRSVSMIDGVDGVVLTGGGDVSPELYGQSRHARLYGTSDDRDVTEILVLEAALGRGIPVLGICRGMQIINVTFGGSLHQHIDDLETTHGFHNGGDHRVIPAEGSRLDDAFGGVEQWVTSLHHQAVDRIAEGFVATGWALDDTVEAMEAVDAWIVGVQFHPEMRGDTASQAIFNRFVAAVAKTAGKPIPAQTPKTWRTSEFQPARERRTASVPAPKPARNTRRTAAASRRTEDVVTRWRCFRCGCPDFDERADYLDHMILLHDVDLEAELDNAEVFAPATSSNVIPMRSRR